MGYQTIELEKTGEGNLKVLWVRFNREDVRNAFNEVLIDELTQVFKGDALAPDIKAVTFSGKGKVFCAGGDLNWMRKSIDKSFEENLMETEKLTEMFRLINECPKPVVGLVHGAAIGGGVGLVSVCDIVLASQETVFSLSEVRLGLVPACIGPFVISKIGGSHARALFVSAERFGAERAKDAGLIHEVLPNFEAVKERAAQLLEQITLCGPNALRVAKELVLQLSWPEKRAGLKDCYHYSAKTLAELRISEEGQEGSTAFLEKRKPAWLK